MKIFTPHIEMLNKLCRVFEVGLCSQMRPNLLNFPRRMRKAIEAIFSRISLRFKIMKTKIYEFKFRGQNGLWVDLFSDQRFFYRNRFRWDFWDSAMLNKLVGNSILPNAARVMEVIFWLTPEKPAKRTAISPPNPQHYKKKYDKNFFALDLVTASVA